MFHRGFSRDKGGSAWLLVLLIACGIGVVTNPTAEQHKFIAASEAARRRPNGLPQLVAKQSFPAPQEEYCELLPGSSQASFAVAEQENLAAISASAAPADSGQTTNLDRPPLRVIRDMDPIYSSVAVDVNTDEVILYDANFFGIKIFNRLENTPPSAKSSVPKREIGGPSISWPNKTGMQFNNGLYVDSKTGDIYSAEADTGDSIAVFSRGAQGDVEPVRTIETPHRAYAIAMNDEKNELYLAVQYPPAVYVYRKNASGDEKPIRTLEGTRTGLMDIQGIAIDLKSELMFITNYGNYSDFKTPGTGKFYPPSITVFKLDARGDTPPLRVIQGPQTQLNWPAQLSVNSERGELYVANNVGDSILVFRQTDVGDAKPVRMIKGPRTGIKNPTGVFADTKNNEVWVSNMGNSSARVYPLDANGDVAPLRSIRSAPEGQSVIEVQQAWRGCL